MNKKPTGLFILILLLTLFTLILNLPKELPLSFRIPKLPFLNKEIVVQQKIALNPSFYLGPYRVNLVFPFKKGLDLEGGTSVTLKADMQGIAKDQRDNALNSAKTVIEKRINYFGVSEPVVQTARVGQDYRIIAEIPGVTDVNQAIALIGKTAKLTFWEEVASTSAQVASPSAIPFGITQIYGSNARETGLSGSELKQANVTFSQNTGKPEVQLTFTPAGTKKFAEITQRNIGKIVAIVLDNNIVSAPRVNEAILNGNAVISGDFTTDQAKSLQVQLNAGALPVPLTVMEQYAIGATLGNISLQKSLFAGILGFIIIAIFMIVLYGGLGIIAVMALIIYTLLVLTFFRNGFFFFPPVTLTLAGIAGFILSIGIAVDANILIFERIHEEERMGKSRKAALELGFSRAWPSIRDSNIASVITSLVLIMFGSSIVRGFAVTLLIGVLISMFSAIVVTRTFLKMFYHARI